MSLISAGEEEGDSGRYITGQEEQEEEEKENKQEQKRKKSFGRLQQHKCGPQVEFR